MSWRKENTISTLDHITTEGEICSVYERPDGVRGGEGLCKEFRVEEPSKYNDGRVHRKVKQ